MNKHAMKARINELECQINYLVKEMNGVLHNRNEELKVVRDLLGATEKRYTELLEKYITMMEKVVNINEHEKAD